MVDYEKLYYKMFNATTDIGLKLLEAAVILQTAQMECEKCFKSEDEALPKFPSETAE